MFNQNHTQKIGDVLIQKGLITDCDLQEALKLQSISGSKLGAVLLGSGKVTAHKFYQSLAIHYDCEFVDLLDDKPDNLFLEKEDRQLYLDLNCIPWRMIDKVMVIATCNISDELSAWAEEKYKNYRFVITSIFDVYWTVNNVFVKQNIRDARNRLWYKQPLYSAKHLFTRNTSISIVLMCLLLLLLCVVSQSILITIFIAINIFYFVTLLFKVYFFIAGMVAEYRQENYIKDITDITNSNVPIYTILAPMYKEKKNSILGLVKSIREFDYPSCKLDVKFIVEEDDRTTIKILKSLSLESYFHIICVPYSYPRTKPKACNYALKFAKGEYITIYDCEDKPDSKQLKMVLKKFRDSAKDTETSQIGCVQCRLNYYNRDESLLTSLFSIEYSAWFDFMIPGLEALHIPVPLGGTSNHFKTETLQDLYVWDPYNVTEDADMGVRLAQNQMTTAIINSVTLEEAPIGLGAWIKQRSRWIKGYMQTYIVHMRNPIKLLNNIGLKGLLGFTFFVGAPAMVFVTMPFVAIVSLCALIYGLEFPSWFIYIALINFVGGVAVHFLIALVVLYKNKWWNLLLSILVFPFYWVLHSLASFKGLYELILKPHYWDKTQHGVSDMLQTGEDEIQ